jgi:glycosyltransferase involved in cell wall biosynthesis
MQVDQKPPLLLIAIPCYRRQRFLRLLLQSIVASADSFAYPLELCIAIVDDSPEMANHVVFLEFEHCSIPIKYFHNETNLGIDKNINRCFRVLPSRFVMVVGEDDIFLVDSIPNIFSCLSCLDDAVNYLFVPYYRWNEPRLVPIPANLHGLPNASQDFIDSFGNQMGFIGANIVRQSALPDFDYISAGTYFNHVGLILAIISTSPWRIKVVPSYCILNRVGALDAFSWGNDALAVYSGYTRIINLYFSDLRIVNPLDVSVLKKKIDAEFNPRSLRSLILLRANGCLNMAVLREIYGDSGNLPLHVRFLVIVPVNVLSAFLKRTYPAFNYTKQLLSKSKFEKY